MDKQHGSRHVQCRKVSINDRRKKADIFTAQVLSLGSFLLGATATSGRTQESVVTWVVLKPPASNSLECPHQIEGGNGALAHGLMVFLVKLRIFVLDDLAHAQLRQLLGHEFLIKQTALKGGLVLNEGGDHLVQILLTSVGNLPCCWDCLPEWLST